MEFYPSCIEKGMRSERALKLAIAEMYVKGVSTRRVSDIVEILCGTEVSSSQVSRLAKELDEEITSWKGLSDRFNTWYLMRPMNRFASVPMWSSRRF
ncbi:transposase [Escherichia coli]|uniref:transposase n=1 Tax=Escherichia coli TaxID=562 RepID=UPI003FA22895